ncbi:alpha/beta hydrolase family protein [Nonomuraea sp. NPDC050663]|uniref:alpha/beta hydrolase family protein n=1 Tax=Nonomuraea sp. NPDC050663 TaxID=3364370 RepID=UPI003795D26A
MRPLELLLSAVNLLGLAIVTLPRLRTRRLPGLAVMPAALLLATAQVLVEGPRWQTAPAYALTAVLFLTWLKRLVRPSAKHVNRLGAGLGALAALATVLLATVMPVFRFPEPTGPYAVGTTTYHWADPGRPELFTDSPDDHRELMAQVWYPAEPQPSAPRAPYIQDADVVTPAMARLAGFPELVFSQLGDVTSHAVASARVAADHPRYPVLISLTGLGGFRAASTFQIQELVSHGYVVVGLDQPGAAAMTRFPDGREIPGWPRDEIYPLIRQSWTPRPNAPTLQGEALPDGIIPYFAQDVSLALDHLTKLNEAAPDGILTGRLDLERAGVFGISWGGATAAEACANDPRLKACLIMDVQMTAHVVKAGLRQPTLFMTRDAATFRLERERSGGWPEEEISGTIDTMTDVHRRLPGAGYYVEIPGLFHVDFTDVPAWSPMTPQLGLNGTIDARRAHDIINAYSLAFFDKHLVGRSPSLLEGPSSRFPEARLLYTSPEVSPTGQETPVPPGARLRSQSNSW